MTQAASAEEKEAVTVTESPEAEDKKGGGTVRFLLSATRRTWDVRFWLANHLPTLLPSQFAGRVRPRLLRLAGVSVGPGCFLWGAFRMNATKNVRQNLRIGNHCFFNAHVWLDLNAPVTFGDNVSVGHHVLIVTASHQIGPPEYRAGQLTPLPIIVGSGAWIGANVTLLPGVTIGEGAVIAAGAVVTHDIPAHVLAGGVPAKVIRTL